MIAQVIRIARGRPLQFPRFGDKLRTSFTCTSYFLLKCATQSVSVVPQNGMWFSIPQVALVDNNSNYLENQQLEPDVKQALDPGVVSQGRDQQLEAAVKLLLGK